MQGSKGQRTTFPLRLSRTIRVQIEQFADHEGISLNQFIVLAVAEKITRLEYILSPRQIQPNPGSLSGDVNHTEPNESAI